jgi:hypothetical protein
MTANDKTPASVKYDSFPADFPSFDEVKAYIKKNQPVTWPGLAKHFNQESDDYFTVTDPRDNKTDIITGHGITHIFFSYLQPFTQLECVVFTCSPILYIVAGGPIYDDFASDEVFPYVTLSIKEDKQS